MGTVIRAEFRRSLAMRPQSAGVSPLNTDERRQVIARLRNLGMSPIEITRTARERGLSGYCESTVRRLAKRRPD